MRGIRGRARSVAVVVLGVSLVAGLAPGAAVAAQRSLRFFGNGVDDIDRVKIRIDDPTDAKPGPPADVGATSFTIEFWMKAKAWQNRAGAVTCGANIDWIYGNIVVDRDRYGQGRKFGLSIAGGTLVWGVTNGSNEREPHDLRGHERARRRLAPRGRPASPLRRDDVDLGRREARRQARRAQR